MKKIISTPSAPSAIGPYSQGVEAGGLVFVSGQLAFVPETGELLEGSVAEMTERSLRNIEAVLKAAGCTLGDVVKTTIFLRDMADFAEVNQAYAAFFPAEPPARSCVQAAALPRGAALEIEAIAVKP